MEPRSNLALIHGCSSGNEAETVRTNRAVAAAFFLLALFLGSTLLATAMAAERKENWNAEWEKTLSAAKKEARVAIFLYQRDNIETAVKAFERRYPDIQVVTASTPAAETGPRIMAERRAGKYLWDLCICGPTTPFAVLSADLVRQYTFSDPVPGMAGIICAIETTAAHAGIDHLAAIRPNGQAVDL